MGERKKVCVKILGRTFALKVPKLGIFRSKKVTSEPEWSWQAAPSPLPAPPPSTSRSRSRSREHRYLTSDQVTNIHSWLLQLPKPGDVSQLELVEDYLADLADLSSQSHQASQSIHTDIF